MAIEADNSILLPPPPPPPLPPAHLPSQVKSGKLADCHLTRRCGEASLRITNLDVGSRKDRQGRCRYDTDEKIKVD